MSWATGCYEYVKACGHKRPGAVSQIYDIRRLPNSLSPPQKMTQPANLPRDFVPIFDFANKLSRPLTLALELAPQEIELAPGDEVQVFVFKDDITLPIHMELGDDYLQIHPHQSWGNWYVYKNGEDVSGEPYRTPYIEPFIGK
jgi:hypothetical protein